MKTIVDLLAIGIVSMPSRKGIAWKHTQEKKKKKELYLYTNEQGSLPVLHCHQQEKKFNKITDKSPEYNVEAESSTNPCLELFKPFFYGSSKIQLNLNEDNGM